MNQLWVVMPVYNEEASVGGVVEEWMPVLRAIVGEGCFTICALNDGSTDSALARLRELAPLYPELRIVDKPNSGHGQSCLAGYRLALAAGAEWIFQIDSDGQCDPRYFADFWRARSEHPVIYGFRRWREDGRVRYYISRIVSFVAYLGAGNWVRDANVPYRLMRADTLAAVVDRIASTFHLTNIAVATMQQRALGIHWLDIGFRNRTGGKPSVKAYSFARRGYELFRQLRTLKIDGGQ